MAKHLSAVAAGSTQTDISAHIRLMGNFFEQGVPADDDTCVRMMRAFPKEDFIIVDITADFYVNLNFFGAGYMRTEDDNGGPDSFPCAYPDCDAYGKEEKSLKAEFYRRIGNQAHEVGSIHARATPDGFRGFIRDVRSAARNLKHNGLCEHCPDPAEALMRIPRGKYCAECCFAVAILGKQNTQ